MGRICLVFEFSVTVNHSDLIFVFCRTISWKVLEERGLLVTNICSTWLCRTLASNVGNGVRCSPEVLDRRARLRGFPTAPSSSASCGAHGGAEGNTETSVPDGARCLSKKGVARTCFLFFLCSSFFCLLFLLFSLKGFIRFWEWSSFSSVPLHKSRLLASRSQYHFRLLEHCGTSVPPVPSHPCNPPSQLFSPLYLS